MIRVRALVVVALTIPSGACAERDVPAVLARTPSGSALRWGAPQVVLTIAPETAGVAPANALVVALERATSRWNHALGKCGAPRLVVNRKVLGAPLIRDDLVNAVLLHEHSWCPPGTREPEECYPADLTGRSHLYPRLAPGAADDGALAGADIELNGVDFKSDARALEASLLHELGHVLGLDHPCGVNADSQRSGGQPKPCTGEAIERQVMHPSWAARASGESFKPSSTEVAALCDVYAARR
jgi:hypothetical protein